MKEEEHIENILLFHNNIAIFEILIAYVILAFFNSLNVIFYYSPWWNLFRKIFELSFFIVEKGISISFLIIRKKFVKEYFF